ncbi:RsmE family RNA methyltransferase [Chryseolinea sp. T2]|uniref:RsmE family RNA methyltransferase n=1 Tax=Chryseolinea sp. T2 TaxID=3129255 RepID=UPI0030773B21
MNLFYQPLISEGVRHLDPDESKHAARALRRRAGDIIHITDGKGSYFEARILSDDQSKCTFELIKEHRDPETSHRIHVAISPLSHPDRLEWFVEKAVELGVNQITLIDCDRTEKRHVKTERLIKIAVGAMKQSQRFTLPSIEGPVPFEAFCSTAKEDQRFIAFVDAANPLHLFTQAKKGKSYLICIGPEGDFTESEVRHSLSNGFEKVSLGTHRLRSETAGVAACHMLDLVNLS